MLRLWVCGWNHKMWPFKCELLTCYWWQASSNFLWLYLFLWYKVTLDFVSLNEILKCDYSNEFFCAVLPCDAVCFKFSVCFDVWPLWILNSLIQLHGTFCFLGVSWVTFLSYSISSVQCFSNRQLSPVSHDHFVNKYSNIYCRPINLLMRNWTDILLNGSALE